MATASASATATATATDPEAAPIERFRSAFHDLSVIAFVKENAGKAVR